MATPKENLVSLEQLTGTKRKTFTKQRDQCVKNCVSGPMQLQANLSSFQSRQHFKVTQLQQRWQELKEREQRAQQHNRELLQQFEKAQEILKEMLACTAAMKTIRMEYELYLEESSPRWQQQLKEKIQVTQRMRAEDNLRSCLKNMEEAEVTKTCKDQYLHSQASIKKSQEFAATQDINIQNIQSDSNQNGSSYYSHVQSSWLTHPQSQTARYPMTTSHQAQNSSHVPPSFPPPPQPFMFHHLASMPSFYPWHMQNAPGWSSLQTDGPWSLTRGAAGLPEAIWGQIYTKEFLPESRVSQDAKQGAETSGASNSKKEKCAENKTSCLSQELDIKPVRLYSGHAESSESSEDRSQMRRKKEEERGSSQCSSSEKESHSSQESSRTSSAITIFSAAVAQSSESDASSGKCITSRRKKRKWKSVGKVAESPRMEKVEKEKTMSKEHDSGSQKDASQCASEESESDNQAEESASENAGNLSADNKSEAAREELGIISIQPNNRAGDEKHMQEISSSGQSSAEEKDKEKGKHEKALGEDNAEEQENNQKDDEQEEGDEKKENGDPEEKNSVKEKQEEEYEDDGEVFSEEEEETGAEDEMEEQECEVKNKLINKDREKRGSASCHDEEMEEDETEQEEEKTEEDNEGCAEEEGESEEEEEQRSGKERHLEEESDSDSIISPQKNRTHIVPEDAAEERGNKTQFSDDDNSNKPSGEDDIEDLLAPQQQKNTKGHLKAAGKPKAALCDKMKIFQVDDDRSTKTDHHSDSDEFDHFYD